MNWMTFISSIVESIIWPVTIMLLIIIFRDPIKEVVPLLKKFKFKSFEVDFERKISSISKKVERAQLPETSDAFNNISNINHNIISRFGDIKNINISSPRSAIIESWIMVEQLLRRLAENQEMNIYNGTSINILNELSNKNIISNDIFEICNELREIRNKAVHNSSFKVSDEKSNEYINLSFRVIAALKDKLKQ